MPCREPPYARRSSVALKGQKMRVSSLAGPDEHMVPLEVRAQLPPTSMSGFVVVGLADPVSGHRHRHDLDARPHGAGRGGGGPAFLSMCGEVPGLSGANLRAGA